MGKESKDNGLDRNISKRRHSRDRSRSKRDSRRDHRREKRRKEDDRNLRRRRHGSSSDESESEDERHYRRKKKDVSEMAKRVERHLKKHHRGPGGFGYSNDNNPFGDPKITERFVWGKKIEKDIEKGKDVRELTAVAERRRQKERIEEIEKVRKRREEREAEREAMAAELEQIQRERARAEAVELELKEEEFHLQQAQVRARQRLSEGRPKAIDLLTNNLFLLDGFDPTEEDPGNIISNLSLYQLQELEKDIDEYQQLDSRNKSHVPFWAALSKVTATTLAEVAREEEIERARVRGLPIPEKYVVREAGWHESLDADVTAMLAGKSLLELEGLESGIIEQLESGEAADPEYWEAVLRRLSVAKARALLREFHADLMEQHLAKLRAGFDVPQTLTSGKDRAVQAKLEAERAEAEEFAAMKEEEERNEKEKSLVSGNKVEEGVDKKQGVEQLSAAIFNEEEIHLSDDDEATGAAMEEIDKLHGKPMDTDNKEAKIDENVTKKAYEPVSRMHEAQQSAAEQATRGEPRSWEDMTHEEQGAVIASSGEWSPRPLPVEHIAGHQVVSEEEDSRMISLLREKVRLRASQQFLLAAASAAQLPGMSSKHAAAAGATEQIYRRMVVNPKSAESIIRTKNPMFHQAALQAAKGDLKSLPVPDESETRFRATVEKKMGDMASAGDAPFGGEVGLESQVYWWHEKYRPRKPKYFNRVHTGYDWNRYNKAHYDSDNPPPKVVQGYKFNIFYPDLIDPLKAPSYRVERDPTSLDGSTCLLRFTAGPPYEDIAFRIVNKDWATDPKRGFKSTFERGILSLYFNLKREFYRR